MSSVQLKTWTGRIKMIPSPEEMERRSRLAAWLGPDSHHKQHSLDKLKYEPLPEDNSIPDQLLGTMHVGAIRVAYLMPRKDFEPVDL